GRLRRGRPHFDLGPAPVTLESCEWYLVRHRCSSRCSPSTMDEMTRPPLASMSALMERLDRALQPLMGVPFGFFGHSVGACMAFEAARQLRSVDGRIAVHLFVSG